MGAESAAAAYAVEDAGVPRGRATAAVAVLALAVRLVNLGTFSMWLDEILETLQVQGDLADAWSALARDLVHPPLEGLISWSLVHLGAGESVRRLLPILLGVVTVVLLMRLAGRLFGARSGVMVGLLAALSPYHVRYSQELRPYSLALVMVVAALVCATCLLRRESTAGWVGLGLLVTGCLYSLYVASLVAVPLVVLVGEHVIRGGAATERARARRVLGGLVAVGAVAGAAFAPWVALVLRMPARPDPAPAAVWDLAAVARRWQFLTVGGVEGEAVGWGALAALLLAVAGLVPTARRRGGVAVLAGLFVGSVGVELALLATDHFSNGRYNVVAWPFLVLLTGIGAAALWSLEGGVRRLLGRALVVALVGASAVGLADYWRDGRPRWDRVATAAALLRAGNEPVLAVNRWTQVCLGYYLERTPVAGDTPWPALLPSKPWDEAAEVAERGCAVAVAAGYPPPRHSHPWLSSLPAAWRSPRTRGAAVYVLGAAREPPASCVRRLPERWRRPVPVPPLPRLRWAGPDGGVDLAAVDFAVSPRRAPLYGWSRPVEDLRGTTFAWVLGREAGVALWLDDREPRELRVRLRPHPEADPQSVRLEVNGIVVADRRLHRGWTEIAVPVPGAALARGENKVVLHFASAASPAAEGRASRGSRLLAAAVDRIELRRRGL